NKVKARDFATGTIDDPTLNLKTGKFHVACNIDMLKGPLKGKQLQLHGNNTLLELKMTEDVVVNLGPAKLTFTAADCNLRVAKTTGLGGTVKVLFAVPGEAPLVDGHASLNADQHGGFSGEMHLNVHEIGPFAAID